MGRMLLGGLVGGIVMFGWGAVSHMLLPTGCMGLKQLPNEDPVMGALKANIREPGLYFYPGMDMTKQATDAEQKAWEAKMSAGPVGLILFNPNGEAMTPRQLVTEFITNLLGAVLGAVVLSKLAGGYGMRVLAATFFGLIAWVSISVSYWNWYRFPIEFITTEAIDQVGGWFLAGLAMAGIVRRRLLGEGNSQGQTASSMR